eukprot:TRINITY_DN455_c3_g1_i1.p1 TRINITY_DN455_c3_g1~~TRINITY_DN455_c3_g1_i1.p1  ORF type:complete len:673 (+),score=231.01 TRINITY_DN455_c3_g1_i1:1970-3988(+)
MTRSKSQSLSKKRKRERQKAKVGTAAHFLTRSQALKRLQISLKDFRRLCILKGVFPREPRKKFKGRSKTYYYLKDIKMLGHEPVLHKFRELKVWIKRLNKAMGRREETRSAHLIEQKPKYHLDHIVKERYPTFLDALRDLDDALCLVQFFAHLPGVSGVPVERVQTCQRIMREFHFAVSKLHALRKAFLSVKGIYYQAEIMGQRITWVSPYEFTQPVTSDVDYRIMLTFLQFYEVLMHFVNVKIFHHLGLKYPPDISQAMDEEDYSLFAILGRRAVEDSIHAHRKPDGKDANELEGKLSQKKKEELEEKIREIGEREMKGNGGSDGDDGEEDAEIDMGDDDESDSENDDDDEEEEEEEEEEEGTEKHELEEEGTKDSVDENEEDEMNIESGHRQSHVDLFHGCKFFLSREVPRRALEFVIVSCGGSVSWERAEAPFPFHDESVTHVIADRPMESAVSQFSGTVPETILQHGTMEDLFVKTRDWIQPQWVFDCVNASFRLPTEEYTLGKALPPHLSPFVDDEAVGYKPDRAIKIEEFVSGKTSGSAPDKTDKITGMATQSGKRERPSTATIGDGTMEEEEEGEKEDGEEGIAGDAKEEVEGGRSKNRRKRRKRVKTEEEETLEMRKMMMTRKNRKIYNAVTRRKEDEKKAVRRLIHRKLVLAKKAREAEMGKK